jgi:5-hydroxyisourate hydrolase
MSGITSHVLDTSRGKPAVGIAVRLELNNGDANSPNWIAIGSGQTNHDGRVPDLANRSIEPGHYRLSFLVADYFSSQQVDSFYPVVRIEFVVDDLNQHYHVPLLLSPFGYSTYRGS